MLEQPDVRCTNKKDKIFMLNKVESINAEIATAVAKIGSSEVRKLIADSRQHDSRQA